MEIVLFRHGIAEDRDRFSLTGRPDPERPLTGRGEERTREAAAGLVSLLPSAGMVAASSYIRARQTADIVADAYTRAGAEPRRAVTANMEPEARPSQLCAWLAGQPDRNATVLVGHEPDLSELAAWFTAGQRGSFLRFKKAGACLIRFASTPGRGGGEIVWFLPPAVLRRLGGGA